MVIPDMSCDNAEDTRPLQWKGSVITASFGSPCKSSPVIQIGNGKEPSMTTSSEFVSDSLRKELILLEKFLQEIKPAELSIGDLETLCQKSQIELQRLNALFVDSASYLPPYEQRLFQGLLQNVNRLLSEKRSAKKTNVGFSFRKGAAAPSCSNEVRGVSQIVVNRNLISPTEHGSKIIAKNGTTLQTNGSSDPKNGNHAVFSELDSAISCGFSGLTDSKQRLCKRLLMNKDVNLKNLHSCEIILESGASTVHMYNLSNCTVISGPVRTSVFLVNCQQCTIVIACQQLRIHDSRDLKCYVHLASGGIIEHTENAQFGPYTLQYEDLEKDFQEADLALNKNDNWQNVQDFDYIVSKKRSPNVKVIPESEQAVFAI